MYSQGMAGSWSELWGPGRETEMDEELEKGSLVLNVDTEEEVRERATCYCCH